VDTTTRQKVSMNDLTAFQRDLLRVIAGNEESKGLEIKTDIEQYYGEDVNHGRLYPNLDTLVEKELVVKGEIDKRSNSYDITQKGMRLIESRDQWNEEWRKKTDKKQTA